MKTWSSLLSQWKLTIFSSHWHYQKLENPSYKISCKHLIYGNASFYFIYLFLQATVTTTPIIRVSFPPSSASATTNIKLNPTTGTAIQKPPTATGTAIFTPSCTTGATIIKPAGVIGTAIRKPSSTMGPVIKAGQMTPNSCTPGTFNQRTNSVTATTIINTSAVKVLLTLAASIIDPNNKTKRMIHALTSRQDVDWNALLAFSQWFK